MSKPPVKKNSKSVKAKLLDPASTLTTDDSSESIEETYRKPARTIKALSDKSIQRLMWECQSESLIDFLWYMKDGDLIKQIVRNIDEPAGISLVGDMTSSWRYGTNPDTASELFKQRGREEAQYILKLMRNLIADGTIENVLGEEK